ncbi:hypothetical protein [Sphingomonas solaris]|uniref:Uncharacterized protein n=1 Tax=Alterirhizorhabdus solaris TaxID=2529389 RepID=A0A558R3D1_9SPHN|nr:hypothetical protein [Sphingomonas solaris]TVV73895.1 hypothetical protein FOY91_11095 [Sphingomonas solaris]
MLIALMLAGAAPVTDAAATADVRCLVATSVLAENGDKAIAQIGYFAAMFWLGRVGDISEADLNSKMTEQALHMTAADISLELVRCGALMKERGEMLARVGASLSRKAARLETR